MFPHNTKILIVDDMMTMRKIVSKTCRDLGYTDLTEAADGALAWQAISSANPPFDLVISDWNMPNSTGIDLVKRIRSDSRFKSTAFLMITAEAEAAQVTEAISAGVDNYVVKPFTPDALKDKLALIYKKKFGSKAA